MQEQKESQQQELTGPGWLLWRNQELTQTFLQLLKGVVQDEQLQWFQGAFRSSSAHEHVVNDARAQGRAEQAQHIINLIEGIKMPNEQENVDA